MSKETKTRGDKAIEWIEKYIHIPEGASVGQKVKLIDFQKGIIKGIYDTPTRRAIISFPRKSAKTTLSAFLLLYHLVGREARPNSQLYSAAQSRDQASILFNLAVKSVRMSPELSAAITIRETTKELECKELGSRYRALSADASTAYGLSPSMVIHDELGQVKGARSELYEALETAGAAQKDVLSIVISTQAARDDCLLSVLIDDAMTGEDKETKLFLFTAPLDADPFSEETIKKANPGWGIIQNPKELMRQAEAAKRMPSSEASFRNLILNQRIDTDDPFITPSVWKKNNGKPDLSVFEHSNVFIGLDLSKRNDLTAAVAIAKHDNVWHVIPQFFVPKDGILDRAKRDKVPYDLWEKQGYLTACVGTAVNYEYVVSWLAELKSRFNIRAVGFDRWNISQFNIELQRAGVELPMKEVGQGFKDMSPAISNMEIELVSGNIRHGDHPVLSMCMFNCMVTSDPAGNRKLDKKKSFGRIDGAVAMAMAFSVASEFKDEDVKKPLKMFLL